MTTLRICHTADWHLGQSLHRFDRSREHEAFLAWLVELVVARHIDVLVVAGDVFDRAVPPPSAEAMYYGFLATLRRRAPWVAVVVVAGNHDSGPRLEAPAPLLRELGVRVTGTLGGARGADGRFVSEPPIVAIERDGVPVARILAFPFLRPVDLLRERPDPTKQLEAAHDAYHRAVARAARERGSHEALLATGHASVRGAVLSPESERPILGGELSDLSIEVFPTELEYVALGHLHYAQSVGGREHVRYSGSPIPLSFGELDHPHQVVVASFEDGALDAIESVSVPRHTELLRVPATGTWPIDELELALARLPALGDRRRVVEARVRLPEPTAALRARLAEQLGDRGELVHVHVERPRPATPTRPTLASLSSPVASRAWGGLLDPRRVVEARFREADALERGIAPSTDGPSLDESTMPLALSSLFASMIEAVEGEELERAPRARESRAREDEPR